MSGAAFPLARDSSRPVDPLYVITIKALLYAFAMVLYLHPLSSLPGIAAAIGGVFFAVFLARVAFRHRLRLGVALGVSAALGIGGVVVSNAILGSQGAAHALDLRGSFITADALTYGLGAFALVFALRVLAMRARAFSLLEVAFVAGAVTLLLADHRNRMINRPRFLSDWAWSMGIDPTSVLVGVGVGAALLAVFFFLRAQRLLKLLTTGLLLLLLGVLFFALSSGRIEAQRASDSLGLSGKGKGGKGKSGQGKGKNDSPFKNDYSNKNEPQPVAVVLLRDDYEPEGGVMYFRQRALSKYNGVHLTAAQGYDKDVLTSLGESGKAHGEVLQHPDHHRRVPTTMYLLVDHPQPPALSHATRLELTENPNPQQFVSAYEVESQVLAVPPTRLLGRRSVPAAWTPQRRQHYLALPDDPRYSTLADIIVRHLDPRYADDDLAKAFAIKRYLEKQGFYTRKSKHSDKDDPAASFLFGSLRGYCVHFAHAAVYLFRSQGIAARVALGYAVQLHKRAGGSSILIMGDRAHAWPEIFLEGVGWVTFDVYPERTDMPPPPPVDYDLEKLLGELARKDPTAGVKPDETPLVIPWDTLVWGLSLACLALLIFGYLGKIVRRVAPVLVGEERYCRWAYLVALDQLSEIGGRRKLGETRERHAQRLAHLAPALRGLTAAHLARAMGSTLPPDCSEFRELLVALRRDLKRNVSLIKRLWGGINPFGWLLTR
ncbi:MAG: hypothetical protein JRH20_05825 [Deltaproteobacteria bacterium]|nr:hypothetical protein [Deltaproteobacteria bacterium]